MSATVKRHCESRLTAGTSPAIGGGVAVESVSYDCSDHVLGVFDGNGNPLTSDLGLPTSALGNRYLFQGREYSWATHAAGRGQSRHMCRMGWRVGAGMLSLSHAHAEFPETSATAPKTGSRGPAERR